MNCKRNDVIVFKALAGGYYCIAVGRVSEYMHNDHLEVEDQKVIYPLIHTSNMCSHRVGYGSIKKIIPSEYMDKKTEIVKDFPELLI